MRHVWALLISFISVLLLWFFSYEYLPIEVPMHYTNGTVDRYEEKFFVMSIFFVFSFILLLITYLFLLFDNKNTNKQKINTPITIFMIIFTFSINVLFLINVKDESLKTEKFLFVLIGLFLILIGNYSPRIKKKNLFIGIRTSATLNDDTTWKKTQRFGGIILVILGILIAFTSLLPIHLAIIISIILIPIGIIVIHIYANRIEKSIS
ncbi:SdpI family protein [Lysinibacillus sp. NPDC094403]|uniref:SdpI family protein n=1 Tax=Lysinibacillus sp. NPDC094403 TaxID=3390581 RepID=UPI003D0532AB